MERIDWRGRAALGACFAGVALAVFGMATTAVVTATSLALVGVYLVVGAIVAAIATFVSRLVGWRWATCAALAWCVAFAWFVGIDAVVAVVALCLGALAIGTRMVRTPSLAVTCGLVVVGGLAGWSLAWPIHAPLAWWAVVLASVAWRRRAIARALVAMRWRWRREVHISPRSAACAVMLVGTASTATWLPNLQADDLAYHLRLPTDLLAEGRYRPDVGLLAWAYAPWLNDTLHAIVAVLGGRVAHGALNGAWLVLVASFAWRWAGPIGASLVAGIPMVGGLATGMHTELPALVLVLALGTVVFGACARRGAVVGVLGGGLLALKAMHALAALPLLAVGLVRAGPSRWVAIPVALALGIAAYVQAWRATGNPVFPLFNGVFRSPMADPVDFVDARWSEPASFRTPWDLVFRTTRFLESGDGALGVTLVAMAGAFAAAVFDRRRWIAAACVAWLVVAPFLVVSYARYLLPGVACMALLGVVAVRRRWGLRAATALAGACIAMNLLLLPAGNWLLQTSALARHVASNGDGAAVARRFLPSFAVLAHLPPGHGVVLATDPASAWVAPLGARGIGVSWYAPTLARTASAADGDASGEGWRRLAGSLDACWLLVDASNASAGLHAFLRAGAHLHAREGDATLWRVAQCP